MITIRTAVISLALAAIPFAASAQNLDPTRNAALVAKARSQGPCRDPWVTIAIWDRFASTHAIQGAGDFGECDTTRYNGGHWSNYQELFNGVKAAFDSLAASHVTTTMVSLPNGTRQLTIDAGEGFKYSQLVSHDGGSLIGSDGAGVVAQGAGNFHVQSTSTERRISLGKSTLIIQKHR
jgi:hypothetical protein